MKRPSDKEVLESLCAKNAEVRWWHFVPFVGLGMCALEDARFKHFRDGKTRRMDATFTPAPQDRSKPL